jgi:phosphatidylglycerophosphatase A
VKGPSATTFARKLVLLLATGFGLGLSPVASGTVGSLPGVVIAFSLAPLSVWWQSAVAATLALLAIPICGMAERHYGEKDDSRIVADEYLTFPICVIGLPWSPWWVIPVAFAVCRAMDIVKPPPAMQAQRLRGGLGGALDDVLSSLYALLINHLIVWLAVR